MPDSLQLSPQPRPAAAPPEITPPLPPLTGADERGARRELRRQVARLERELGELFASAFPRRRIEWAVTPGGGPRILGIAELEQVRDGLVEKIGEVRTILRERADDEGRMRALLEELIAHPERHHWGRISNEDIGEPGCRHWHSRPRYGVIGMLMGWWRVKVSSGCPLAGGRRAAASRTNRRGGGDGEEAPA